MALQQPLYAPPIQLHWPTSQLPRAGCIDHSGSVLRMQFARRTVWENVHSASICNYVPTSHSHSESASGAGSLLLFAVCPPSHTSQHACALHHVSYAFPLLLPCFLPPQTCFAHPPGMRTIPSAPTLDCALPQPWSMPLYPPISRIVQLACIVQRPDSLQPLPGLGFLVLAHMHALALLFVMWPECPTPSRVGGYTSPTITHLSGVSKHAAALAPTWPADQGK